MHTEMPSWGFTLLWLAICIANQKKNSKPVLITYHGEYQSLCTAHEETLFLVLRFRWQYRWHSRTLPLHPWEHFKVLVYFIAVEPFLGYWRIHLYQIFFSSLDDEYTFLKIYTFGHKYNRYIRPLLMIVFVFYTPLLKILFVFQE